MWLTHKLRVAKMAAKERLGLESQVSTHPELVMEFSDLQNIHDVHQQLRLRLTKYTLLAQQLEKEGKEIAQLLQAHSQSIIEGSYSTSSFKDTQSGNDNNNNDNNNNSSNNNNNSNSTSSSNNNSNNNSRRNSREHANNTSSTSNNDRNRSTSQFMRQESHNAEISHANLYANSLINLGSTICNVNLSSLTRHVELAFQQILELYILPLIKTKPSHEEIRFHYDFCRSNTLKARARVEPDETELLGALEEEKRALEEYERSCDKWLKDIQNLKRNVLEVGYEEVALGVAGFKSNLSVSQFQFNDSSTTDALLRDGRSESDMSTRGSKLGNTLHYSEDKIDWIDLSDEIALIKLSKLTDEELKERYSFVSTYPKTLVHSEIRYMSLTCRSDETLDVSGLYLTSTKEEEIEKETEDFGPMKYIQYIVIRGTNFKKLKHIVLDLSYSKIYEPKLKMNLHKGFQSIACELLADVVPTISKEHPIRIVGHSLGSSVGCILGCYLVFLGYTVDKITGFGTPRFTDSQGAAVVNRLLPNKILRVNNYMDVVRLMPNQGFCHVGSSLMMFESGKCWYFEESPQEEPSSFVSHTQSFLHHRSRFYAKLIQGHVEAVLGCKFSHEYGGQTSTLYNKEGDVKDENQILDEEREQEQQLTIVNSKSLNFLSEC